jgi:uncharacterized protein (TIGR02145 family)
MTKRLPSILLILFLTSCNNSRRPLPASENKSQPIENFSVINKQANTTIIGTQMWTTINLNVEIFKNGDSIFEAKTINEFKNAGDEQKPAWCYYNNDSLNARTYGKLYNWYAVNDKRGLAPTGWHIPTTDEWETLTNYLGGENICGSKLRNTSGWYTNGNGINSSGFTALPGGSFLDNEFHGIGKLGFWWTNTECYNGAAYARYLNYNYDPLKFASFNSSAGFSVRCVKDQY